MKRTYLFLLVLVFWHHGGCAMHEPIAVTLNPRRAVHVLNDHFVSLNLNPTDLLQGRPFGMGSNSTLAILKGLAPAYVRLGGTDTNKYLFKAKNSNIDHAPDEIIIPEEHWKGLNDFLRKSGMDVVVCLNSAHRGGNPDKWDPRNALEMITFSDRQQYNITWQLGYEPIRIENVSGTQFGKDISQLRSILNAFPRYRDAKIIGPDIRTLHKKDDVEHVLDILIESGPAINAVTWHPRWPHASAITPSDASEDGYDFPPDYLEWDRNQLHKLLQRTLLKKPFWISEPKAENTGSFAEGLIFARRLALAAKLGIEVVMKQPSMQDISHPKPEYWMALFHKKTMGRTLLDTRTLTNNSEVHLVVQCANKMYMEDQDGGITVLAVNTAGSGQRAVIRGLPIGHIGEIIHQYVLTGGNEHEKIFSQMTYLNGEPLLMTDNGELPELSPKQKHLGQTLQIKLPPYSAGFWVVPRAKVKLCQQEPESIFSIALDELSPTLLKTTQKGVNSLHNMNHIIETLLNPIDSKEEDEEQEINEEESTEHKRTIRAIDIESLGAELKKNMDEVKKLMEEHRNSHWRTTPQSASSENQLRVAERKIDGLVDDLNTVIHGADQKAEFELFLEKAGLKSDFGPMMRQDHRKKRDVNPATLKQRLFFKEGDMDLAEIERRFRRILAKHKKNMDVKRPANLQFGKLNRDMHEDLLLKEITLLEKTEETLAEVMKNRQERFEQMEEMIHNELEQIKDEKLAALVEIKSNVPKMKRDTAEDNPVIDNLKKLDPFSAFREYVAKRKDELAKRRKAVPKFQLNITADTTTEETATHAPSVALNDDEKRREEVLKSMAESIGQAQPGSENSASLDDDMFAKRKPRKIDQDDSERRTINLSSILIEKILEILKESKDLPTFHRIKENATVSTTPATETTEATTDHTIRQNASESDTDLTISATEPTTDLTKHQNTSESTTDLKISATEPTNTESIAPYEAFAAEATILESAIPTSTESVPVLPNEGQESTDASSGPDETSKTMESTTTEITKQEQTTEIAEENRVRRNTDAISDPTEAIEKINRIHSPASQEILGNNVVKKAKTKSKDMGKEEEEMFQLAGSTVKTVLDEFIPKAYDTAKEKIESIGLADYLKNLGSMIEKLQHMDMILKDAAILTRNTSEHHIQKIQRNRRETNETTTEEPQPIAEDIEELMATDDALEKALDSLAEQMINSEIKENALRMTDESSEEDPISPRLGKEQTIIKEIINTLMRKQEPKRNPRHSLPEDPVSDILKKLRPGVYVVPSKDMANVHAEQTAKSAIARKDGKPTANVLTMNIYYDKTEKSETAPSHVQEIYGRQWQPEPTFYRQPEKPVMPYPTRYSMFPHHQQKYYSMGNMPDEDMYQLQAQAREPSPKIIPLTSWTKPEQSDPWQLTDLPEPPKYWTAEKSPELVEKETEPPIIDETTLDRRQSIEPYWNKTIRDIFQETADDPFWKFLDQPEPKTDEVKEHEPNEQHQNRRKRSLEYSTNILYDTTPYPQNNDYFLSNNKIDYRRDRRSMLNNYIIKQKQSDKYPTDSNRVVHGRFKKHMKKLGALDSSLEAGPEITKTSFVQPIEFMYPVQQQINRPVASAVEENETDPTISFPIKQIYDMAVDFVKRLSSAV